MLYSRRRQNTTFQTMKGGEMTRCIISLVGCVSLGKYMVHQVGVVGTLMNNVTIWGWHAHNARQHSLQEILHRGDDEITSSRSSVAGVVDTLTMRASIACKKTSIDARKPACEEFL